MFETICESIGTRLAKRSGEANPNTPNGVPNSIFGAPWMDILKMISEILIPLLANCSQAQSSRTMMERLKSPRLLERAAMKTRIRQHLQEEDGKLFGLRNRVNEVAEAFYEEAQARSEDEINQVVADCCSA